MTPKELPLIALRAFSVAARTGSLIAAAVELGVTHGAVSKQVAALELWLGQSVFSRQRRYLVLTPYGKILADRLGESINEMATACDYVRRQRAKSVISVEAPTTLATYWLLEHLKEFESLNPSVSVWITTRMSGQTPDFGANDVVITRGEPSQYPRLRDSRVLFQESLTVVTSESVLSQSPVRKPKDILGHKLIVSATRPGDWESWFEFAKVEKYFFEGGHRFDHLFVALHAVRMGFGSTVAPCELLQKSLERGDFRIPLPKALLKGQSYWVNRTLRAEGKYIDKFVEWVGQKAQESMISVNPSRLSPKKRSKAEKTGSAASTSLGRQR
jgi:LysR family transcriptional regulator, glycine cleavage system transcriptional activator